MHVVQMKCPGCGASLEVASDMENFACGYCGASLRTVRRGGTVSLLSDAITKVQHGTDRTAAELALIRLKAEFNAVESEILLFSFPQKPAYVGLPTAVIVSILLLICLWFFWENAGPLSMVIAVGLAVVVWTEYLTGIEKLKKHTIAVVNSRSTIEELSSKRELISNQINANLAIINSHDNSGGC